jgi:PAS domain S-box-containing protein
MTMATDRFLAAIVASSDDAIVGKTLDGTITSWNPAAERLYGFTAEEAIGQPITLVIPEDRPDELPMIMTRMRHGQRIDHYETIRRHKDGRRLEISVSVSPVYDEDGAIIGAASIARDITERRQRERERRELEQRAYEAILQREAALHESNTTLEIINRVGRLLAAELDLERLIQAVTDAATTLTGAQFGAFFYNALDARGEFYTLYAIAGVPREAFSQFPLPRNTALFAPTFRGEGTVRVADVRLDPRFGQNAPYYGMPEGHLPVVSYLAVPVIGHDGTVLGGLFFGHAEPDVFGERAERLVEGLAGQAAVAVENARLFQQVQRELAARTESEARFRAVWAATSEALALSDPDGRVLDVNPAYCELYGRRAEELIGESFALIFAEDARPAAEVQYREIFAHPEAPPAYDACVQRPDGSERIVEARSDFLVHEGQRVAMVSAIHDITERVQMEAALQASEARFRTLIERSIDAIQLVTPDGVILYTSDSVESVLGYQPGEILGRSIIDYLHPEDLAGIIAWVDGVAATPGGVASHRYRVRHKDGSWAWVDATLANHLATPSIGALVGNFRNVTDRVREEMEREAFVDAAAHDLKTPLTTVLAQAQLLRRRTGRPQGLEPAALASGLLAIEGAAGRMAALIEEMMDAAHLSAGRKLELRFALVDLLDLVEAAVEETQRAASGHTIRIEAGAAALAGMWDTERLARVLANLLSNAVKYSPVRSEVIVQVGQVVDPDGSAWATVAVRDEGMGIPAAEMPRLFERFYRGTNVSGRTHGTGIGLSGARQIVEQHGGTILVESEEGRGSTFTIRLPLTTVQRPSSWRDARSGPACTSVPG